MAENGKKLEKGEERRGEMETDIWKKKGGGGAIQRDKGRGIGRVGEDIKWEGWQGEVRGLEGAGD